MTRSRIRDVARATSSATSDSVVWAIRLISVGFVVRIRPGSFGDAPSKLRYGTFTRSAAAARIDPMTVVNAHFDGKQVVLDEPMPTGVPANAKLRVIVQESGPVKPRSLEQIAAMAVHGKLPRDFALNHRRYAKGAPRR